MSIKNILLCVALTFFAATTINAQTIHSLIVCADEDPKIGAALKKDKALWNRFIQEIPGILDCELSPTIWGDKDCTKENVRAWIRDLEVEPDDVVIFFYSGHGGRALNDTDPLPQMCMNNPSLNSGYLPVSHVQRWISEKHPRLTIIVSECCNGAAQGVSVKPYYALDKGAYSKASTYDADAFKKLFMDCNGTVVMTSSKAGQLSWCNILHGSYFVVNLLNALDKSLKNNGLTADWESIFQYAKIATSQERFKDENGVRCIIQEPYAQINLHGNDRGRSTPPTSTSNSGSLYKSLRYLSDSSINAETRLNNVPTILKRHFQRNAYVLTIANDNNTIVDHEDAAHFLERLVFSDNIKIVSVVEGSDTEPNQFIKVHELHK